MLKSLEIKGFIGGNRENEIRNRNILIFFMLFFIIDYMCLSSTFYSVLQVLHPYTTLHKLIYIYWLLVLKWYADGTQII